MTTYKDVPNFPGYRVGDDGSVWSCRKVRNYKWGDWRKLKPNAASKYGDMFVALMRDSIPCIVKVHHLVLFAFVGPKPNGMETLHGDGNSRNNALSNLRWGTKVENGYDTRKHGRKKGEHHPLAKLNDDIVRSIRIRYASGESQYVIADSIGVHQSIVSKVLSGHIWSHVP